jgi:hypothetical protein
LQTAQVLILARQPVGFQRPLDGQQHLGH